MKKHPIVFLFNSPLQSGCDYVIQTMRAMGATHPLYGLALGDLISLPKLVIESHPWVVRHFEGTLIIRPVACIPGIRFRWVRIATYAFYAVILRILVAIRHPATPKMAWFFEPFHLSRLLHLFWGFQTLYDCVDYYPAFHPLAAAEHAAIVKQATYVFANSVPLFQSLSRVRPDTRLVPVGFADSLFVSHAVRPIRPGTKKLVVGYIGGISARMDFDMLIFAAKKLPRVGFRFAGPIETNVFGSDDDAGRKFTALRNLPNVSYVGELAKHRIPRFLSSIHIGIIPYREDSAFNTNSFPMKTLEYFAAGRPVIATRIAALEDYRTNGLLNIVSSQNAFVDAITVLQRKGWTSRKQKEQYAVAMKQRWAEKIRTIRESVPMLSP